MTYDEWKLETPEDEHARNGWRSMRNRYECSNCGFVLEQEDDSEWECIHCGTWNNLQERDPDDARDERMDREMDQ
jgi:predicted ATP-dependent serine protease